MTDHLIQYAYLVGAVLGAVIMQVLSTTIHLQNISPDYNLIVKALVVLAVCLLQSASFRAAIGKT